MSINKEQVEKIFKESTHCLDDLMEKMVWDLSSIINHFGFLVEFVTPDTEPEDIEITDKKIEIFVEACNLLYQIYKDAE